MQLNATQNGNTKVYLNLTRNPQIYYEKCLFRIININKNCKE